MSQHLGPCLVLTVPNFILPGRSAFTWNLASASGWPKLLGCLKEEPSPLQGVEQSLIERPDITVVATHSRLPAVTSGLSTLVGPAFGELSGELLAGLAALECLHMRQCLPIAAKERSCG